MGICVFDDLHCYSRERAMAFGRIGVITGLLVEASTSFQNGTVSVCKLQCGKQCTSGFSVNLMDHPIFNSHVTLNFCPASVSPFCPLCLTPAHPGHTPPCPNPKHTYAHILTHILPSWNQRSIFFQRLPYDIHCHNMVSQFWKGWGGGWGRGEAISPYPPNEQSSVLKYLSSVVTETAVGFSPPNQKDNYT